MTGFAPKYFLIIFGLLFVAYYPIAIGMAIYVGGLYWLFSKDNPTNWLNLINIERLIDDFKNLQNKY